MGEELTGNKLSLGVEDDEEEENGGEEREEEEENRKQKKSEVKKMDGKILQELTGRGIRWKRE